MAVAVIGDHVPCAEPGARVVATTAAWGGAIGSLKVALVVVFANLVNHLSYAIKLDLSMPTQHPAR